MQVHNWLFFFFCYCHFEPPLSIFTKEITSCFRWETWITLVHLGRDIRKGKKRMKRGFRWRTLGLYRQWHRQRFPSQQKRQLRWMQGQQLGSSRHRWPCGGLGHCSISQEEQSDGGKHPGGSVMFSHYHHCALWVVHPLPEWRCDQKKMGKRKTVRPWINV